MEPVQLKRTSPRTSWNNTNKKNVAAIQPNRRRTKSVLPSSAVLAGAYANRGIVYDRQGDYEKALESYIEGLKVDEEAVSGPGVINKILYGLQKPSSVRDRARYIYEQLQLPEDQRLLSIPEIDAQQRMFKP